MSKSTNTPSHIIYISLGKSKATGKDILSKVGALWPHKTGTGFNLKLNAQSINGEYVVFEHQSKIESSSMQGQSAEEDEINADDVLF